MLPRALLETAWYGPCCPWRSYINGKPFVVREAERPFSNLEYTGIDRERVESMEARLKADVLAEAAQYGSQVLVAHEDDQFQARRPMHQPLFDASCVQDDLQHWMCCTACRRHSRPAVARLLRAPGF